MGMPLTVHRFTVDDLERMVKAGILEEDARVELLDGQVVEMSPINPPHAACVNRLTRLFAPLLTGNRASLSIQNALVLDRQQMPQPDVAVLRYRADGYRIHHPGSTDAFLLIEVADTTLRRDRRRKIPLYARAEVAEAWLVNLPEDSVEVHLEPQHGRYQDIRPLRRGETIAPLAFPDLRLRVDEILA